MRIDLKAPEAQKIRQDAIIKQLSNTTHAQIDEWVDAHVNDMNDVRRVLKWLLKLNIHLFKKEI